MTKNLHVSTRLDPIRTCTKYLFTKMLYNRPANLQYTMYT